jgi:hypothetical protein
MRVKSDMVVNKENRGGGSASSFLFAYARHAKRNATDVFRAEVDFERSAGNLKLPPAAFGE